MAKKYQICTRTVMDTSDPDIKFDKNGVCQYVKIVEEKLKKIKFTEKESQKKLNELVKKIKKTTKGKEYECLIGLSGGVDSTYAAYIINKIGLKPLVVHFDNGWNSETAIQNIKNTVKALNYNLITYVIDWEEFRDLQRTFLKASVVDIELLTDHAILASMYKIARQNNIRYIISGNNIATENFMPSTWLWNKQDARNIKAIHKIFGEKKLKSFPFMGNWHWNLVKKVGIIEFIKILNFVNYRKDKAMKILQDKLGWRYYGGKHYESTFTKFYQAYILPKKFNIDKRKVHLSSLILNDEITRSQALNELKKPLYGPTELKNDKEYVLKKLGFSEKEFEKIMKAKPLPHTYYKSDNDFIKYLKFYYACTKQIRKLPLFNKK